MSSPQSLSLLYVGFLFIGRHISYGRNMYTTIYYLIGSVNLALLIYAVQAWRRTRSLTVLLITLPMAFLWYDNYVIAAGTTLGEGPLLKGLSFVRFASHYLLLPFWFIVIARLMRTAGYRVGQTRWLQIAAVATTIGFAGWEMYEFLHLELLPVCLGDTLRYSTFVGEGQECYPGMAGTGGYVPLAGSFALIGLLLLLGGALWRTHNWPWLFVGTLVMFVFAGIPSSVAGPFLSNMAEPVINGAILATALRLEQPQQTV